MYVVTAWVEYGEEDWVVGVYTKASTAVRAAQAVAANLKACNPTRTERHYWGVDAVLVPLDEVPA